MTLTVEINEPGTGARIERPPSLPADVGRAPSCTVRLDSPAVSARHCSLVRSAGQTFVVDRHSTNGTHLNGKRLVPGRLARLFEGDVVQIGGTTIRFRDGNRTVAGGTRTIFRHLLEAADVGETDAAGPALVALNGPAAGSSLRFPSEDGGTATVGRDVGAALMISDRLASARHFIVTKRAGAFRVSDCDSRNGTFVNGQRISGDYGLAEGDVITAGDTAFIAVGLPKPGIETAQQSRPADAPSVERFVVPAAALVGLVCLGLAAVLVGYALS